MKRHVAVPVAAFAAVALAIAPAPSAMAADQDVVTPGWEWLDVEDNGYRVQDVEARYTDFLGSGVALDGWRDDAFDDLMRVTAYDFDAEGFIPTYPIVRFGADELGPLSITPVSADWVDNGRTTTVGTAVADFGDGRVVTVTMTLEIENSTVRWTIDRAVVGGDDELVEVIIGGDLGSDSDSTYVDLGGSAWISHDTNRGDPVIAWRFGGVDPTMGLPFQQGGVEFSMAGAGSSTITVGVIDFDACSFDDAIDTMSTRAPSLSLGQSIPPLYATDCLLAEDPAQLGPGEAADSLLPLSPAAALDALCCWVPETSVDFDDEDWQVEIVDAPAGLVAAMEWSPDAGSFAIRLSGTPTEPWSGPATFVVHDAEEEPVLVEIELEVAAAPELAATGSPALHAGMVFGGLFLLLGGATLAISARRSAADSR